MMHKRQVVEPLARLRNGALVVSTMGLVRTWGRLSPGVLNFASADSAMGHAADLALGLALARPDIPVICLNGDGSMLMSLGTLVTIAEQAPANLTLVIAENGTYEITGNQAVPGAGRISFSALARGAGIANVYSFRSSDAYSEALPGILETPGPRVIHVVVRPGKDGPVLRRADAEIRELQESLAASAHALRRALRNLPRAGCA